MIYPNNAQCVEFASILTYVCHFDELIRLMEAAMNALIRTGTRDEKTVDGGKVPW